MTSPLARAGPARSVLHERDADRPTTFRHDRRCMGPGLHPKVGPTPRRIEVGRGCGPAAPSSHVELEPVDALLFGSVDVAMGQPELHPGRDHSLRNRMAGRRIGYVQRAARTVIGALAAQPILAFDEIGKHVICAPSGTAQLTPAIVVGSLPAHV